MQLNNFWFDIGSMVVSFIFGGLFVFVTKVSKYLKNEKFVTKLDGIEYVKETSRINEILSELRIVNDCNRVSLYQFHNGGHFLDGSSILKVSITHESCDILTIPTIKNYQGEILSRFNSLMQLLHKNNTNIQYVSEMQASMCKYLMESKGVEIFALIPLYSTDGLNMVGFISVEWTDIDMKVDNTLLQKQSMETQRLLQIFLNTSNKKGKK